MDLARPWTVAGPMRAMALHAVLFENRLAARHVHGARGKIERAFDAERDHELPMDGRQLRRGYAPRGGRHERVENEPYRGRVRRGEPACDFLRILQEVADFIELRRGNDLAVCVDAFRVLFDGNADDRRQPFGGRFLRAQQLGRSNGGRCEQAAEKRAKMHCLQKYSG